MSADERVVAAADVERLLAYAHATYRTVTDGRRRLAVILLVAGLLFSLLAVISAGNWWATRRAAAAVQDTPLVEALGVSIPDPRPGLERTQLRVRSLLHGSAAIACAGIALLLLGVAALVRPTGLAPPPAQPPMYDISTRSSDARPPPRISE